MIFAERKAARSAIFEARLATIAALKVLSAGKSNPTQSL
jgi:hypothetical protein